MKLFIELQTRGIFKRPLVNIGNENFNKNHVTLRLTNR